MQFSYNFKIVQLYDVEYKHDFAYMWKKYTATTKILINSLIKYAVFDKHDDG